MISLEVWRESINWHQCTSSKKNIIIDEEIECIYFIETHLSSHDCVNLVHSQLVQDQESKQSLEQNDAFNHLKKVK